MWQRGIEKCINQRLQSNGKGESSHDRYLRYETWELYFRAEIMLCWKYCFCYLDLKWTVPLFFLTHTDIIFKAEQNQTEFSHRMESINISFHFLHYVFLSWILNISCAAVRTKISLFKKIIHLERIFFGHPAHLYI